MKASKFSDAQKAFIVKQGEDGTPVAGICRRAGICQATHFNWKKKYAGLLRTEMMRLGTPMDLYERPANRFVAGVIGAPSMNFLPVRVDGTRVESPGLVSVPVPRGREMVTKLGVRPEHLSVAGGSDADITGEIELIERLGAETYAYIRVLSHPADLTLRLPGETGYRPGGKIGLKVDWSRAHRFDGSGRVL
jgi:ABC-type sugar transport system ATPase subunit